MRVGDTVIRAVLGTIATEHLLPETSPNGAGLAGRQIGSCSGTDVLCGVTGCMPYNAVCCVSCVLKPPV